MKKKYNKLAYQEPETLVSTVECEGFICESLVLVKFEVEVDEHVNKESESIDFDSDW